MENFGVPDLLGSKRLQRSAGQVSVDLARSGEELSTGIVSDIGTAVAGNPQKLYAIERDLKLNETFSINILTAGSRAEITQDALTVVQNNSQDLGVKLLAAVDRQDPFSAEFEAKQARSNLESSISSLNARFADRALFSGAAATGPALATSNEILAEIQALTSGLTSAVDAIAAVETYFTDPTGFDATGYLGSLTDAPEAEISEGERVNFAVRADNDAIKESLKGLVLGVVGSEDGFFAGTDDSRLTILREAGTVSFAATEQVIELRSAVGFAEEKIEDARVRNLAEKTFLEQARLKIIGRDQFEAAAEFSALETQLQSVFQVTARLSQLSITNFL